jgi:type III secretion protein T
LDFFKAIASAIARDGETASFLLSAALAATRIYVVLRMLPPLGGRVVPPLLRLALSLVLAWMVTGAVQAGPWPPAPMVALLFLKEAAVGFVIGFTASLPFYFAEQAGFLVDAGRGGAMSALMSPTGEEQSTPFSSLFFYLCVILFFAGPAGASFWTALDASFRALPVLPAASFEFARERILAVAVAATGKLLLASVMLAFPVLLLVLLVDILAGILGRFFPAGGSYFLSMPLRSAVGIGGGILALLFLSPIVEGMLLTAMDAMNRLLAP